MANKKGEIEFRKKLVSQQVEGHKTFADEYDAKGIENILKTRMKNTLNQMIAIKESGKELSPYLEIGAERCQRSLIMENEMEATGAAADISFDMLKSGDYYKDIFSRNKIPLRICCDANNLPFLSDSIPFIFCYETLHHFPDPSPVVQEIYKALSPGGYFYFSEEPYKKVLHINLLKGKKAYSQQSLSRNKLRRIFDYFFSESTCNEVEHGVLENHDIPIKIWKQTLSCFDEHDIDLKPPGLPSSKLFNPQSSYLTYLGAYLLGGLISGMCRKHGNNPHNEDSILNLLICPSCKKEGNEVLLTQNKMQFFCEQCSKKYPVMDAVIFLLAYDTFEELYPEIFNTMITTVTPT
jgi:SAM-dependent methyltransferase/uncharacterized protein YbaR (Trm112 family)